MVPTQFHRLLQLPRGGAGTRYDVSSLQVGRPFGGAVPARGEAPDDGVVGPGDLGDLRRHGGCGDDRQAAPVVGEAGHRRTGGPRHPRWPSSTTTAASCRRARSAGSTTDSDVPSFEYVGDAGDDGAAYRGRLFTLGDVGYLDDDGYLFICDRAKDMIITGGVNMYPARRSKRCCRRTRRWATSRSSALPDAEWGETIVAVVAARSTGVRPTTSSPTSCSRTAASAAGEVQVPAPGRVPGVAAAHRRRQALQARAPRRVRPSAFVALGGIRRRGRAPRASASPPEGPTRSPPAKTPTPGPS